LERRRDRKEGKGKGRGGATKGINAKGSRGGKE